MTGYQEILTDPSYKGQIITMTYPLIGNYGCNEIDVESIRPQAEGFVVREYSAYESNWRSQSNLGSYLEENGIIGIHGIDTRALTKRLRVHGVMDGILSTEDLDPQSLVAKAQAWHGLVGVDMVQYVTCPNPYLWETRDPESNAFPELGSSADDRIPNSRLILTRQRSRCRQPPNSGLLRWISGSNITSYANLPNTVVRYKLFRHTLPLKTFLPRIRMVSSYPTVPAIQSRLNTGLRRFSS